MTVVDYKIQMDPEILPAEHQQAFAESYQLLSVAWSYPTAELYESFTSGGFQNTVNQSLNLIPHGELLTRSSQSLNEGIDHYLRSHELLDLESEYIALFENNFDAPVVHLYQHLYVSDSRSQIDVLKAMNRRYHRLGIALKQGEGVEQPDHLSLQLECMAYCYLRLAQSVENAMASAANFYFDEIRQFKNELVWLDRFADQLHRHHHHPIYLPLAAFSQALLLTSR